MNVVLFYVMVMVFETHQGFGQSLARLKNVTMSSQHEDWAGPRIVDGDYNRNTAGSCDCCAATSIERNLVDQWMEIDLGEPNTFNRIVVHGRNDNPDRQSLGGLAIHLDSSDVSIASIDDDQGYVNFYHFDLRRSFSARRIKFVLKGTDKVLILCEVDVFKDVLISNVATAEMSSTFSDWTADRVIDGIIGDPDNCMCCAATIAETNPWLRIDLGTTFLITYIDIHGRTDSTDLNQSLQDLEVDVDGVVIETLPTTGGFISSYQIYPSPETIGRRLTFTLKGINRLLIMCEVTIYGERVISIDKQAYVSSQFDTWAASRAVDGDYRTVPGECNCCAATGTDINPWLRVDLGLGFKVSRIILYGRTDWEYPGHDFSDSTIIVNTTRVDTVPVTSDWVYFHSVQLTTAQQADYVTLTLSGRRQLIVCELVLYGDCIDGFYGEMCDRQCHCEGAPCPTISGICPAGRCFPGYRTETCSEECEDGKYGQDCAMICSPNCKDGRPCNYITGHCEECEPGYTYTDPFCRTPCDDGRYGNNCAGICGKCRDGQPCNFVTGHCTECEDGFKYSDTFCKTACDGGTYGTNCNEMCGNCRNDATCFTIDGYCTECMDGYMETDRTCKTRCEPGVYGRNCVNKCGSCRNQPCDYVIGHCDDCLNGTYVYSNRRCDKPCANYTYGYNCTERCGYCKNGDACDPVGGACSACENGYDFTDSQCNTDCPSGTFGNCENDCGMCKSGDLCDRRTGECPNGCFDGYLGDQCLQMVTQQDDDSDTTISIPILVGAIAGSILVTLVVVLTIVVFKQRRTIQESNRREVENTAPANQLPNSSHALSNYEALQLDNAAPESAYSELK